jgi:hypothetical protein
MRWEGVMVNTVKASISGGRKDMRASERVLSGVNADHILMANLELAVVDKQLTRRGTGSQNSDKITCIVSTYDAYT